MQMWIQFLRLEWKEFFRSASLGTNLLLKILKIAGVLYFIVLFVLLGFGLYYGVEEELGADPFSTVNTYLIYYFAGELLLRFFFQNLPVGTVKTFLTLNIKRKQLVRYYMGKSLLSPFNFLQLFLLIPFAGVLIFERGNAYGVLSWSVAVYALCLSLHFLNILLNKKRNVFFGIVLVVGAMMLLQYYGVAAIAGYCKSFFLVFYRYPWTVFFPIVLCLALMRVTYRFYADNLYLDAKMLHKKAEAKVQNLKWLDGLGQTSMFLKNDIRLILRNKRARTTVLISALFLLYGLLLMTDAYDFLKSETINILIGFMVTGGFMMMFGQYVPSWDSTYYPLMMTQNITYREYLKSKWMMIAFGTSVSVLLAAFYLYFDIRLYLVIVAMGVYNIGINGYLVLLGGAFMKSPVDLESNSNVFGERNMFNLKVMLLAMPKVLLPFLCYFIGRLLYGFIGGIAVLLVVGLVGLLLKNRVFDFIEKIYKKEKYDTLRAYKQK